MSTRHFPACLPAIFALRPLCASLGAFLCALLPATAQTATHPTSTASYVRLGGVVDAALRRTTNEGLPQSNLIRMSGGMAQSRLHLDVQENLGSGSSLRLYLEHRFNTDTGLRDTSAPFWQLAHIGLRMPWGQLTAGRQWNVLFDSVASSYPSFPHSPFMEAYKPELGLALGARLSNMLKYTVATPQRDWVASLQYSFGEGEDSSSIERAALTYGPGSVQMREEVLHFARGGALKSAGAFVRFSRNGLSLAGAAMRITLPGRSRVDAWTLGGSFQQGPWYFSGGYGANRVRPVPITATGGMELMRQTIRQRADRAVLNHAWAGQTESGFQSGDATRREMFRLGLDYQITPRLNIGAHYYYARQKGSPSGHSNGRAHFAVAVTDYTLSKRTDVYLALDRSRILGGSALEFDTTSHARRRSGITVGIRHRF